LSHAPQPFCFQFVFKIGSHVNQSGLKQWSLYLSLPSTWSHRPVPPCLACFWGTVLKTFAWARLKQWSSCPRFWVAGITGVSYYVTTSFHWIGTCFPYFLAECFPSSAFRTSGLVKPKRKKVHQDLLTAFVHYQLREKNKKSVKCLRLW
jgi:hypothetical protein